MQLKKLLAAFVKILYSLAAFYVAYNLWSASTLYTKIIETLHSQAAFATWVKIKPLLVTGGLLSVFGLAAAGMLVAAAGYILFDTIQDLKG